MKKIFFVSGELSGDKLGAWYLKKLLEQEKNIFCAAVGGTYLKEAGAEIYERFETLNIVGVIEILKHACRILRFIKKLAKHIVSEGFEEVVVIDFPGFNLRLIKKLKKLNKNIKISYLSPPQLWVWGERRIKKIKKYCDDVIVIYPFEVEWYKKRGVTTRWLGYPFYDRLKPYFSEKKERAIAIIPGSRMVEVESLLPIFLKIVRRLKIANSGLKIIIPLAESIDSKIVEAMVKKADIGWLRQDVVIVKGENEKFQAMSKCCIALTKPGTITLELALLMVPSVVAYKTSWLTYMIAKRFIRVSSMTLPNLLLNEQVFPELIQDDCTEKKIWEAVEGGFQDFVQKKAAYTEKCTQLKKLRDSLSL